MATLPGLAYAGDKELRLQTLHVFLRRTSFEIHQWPANTKFLEWLSLLDFSSLRSGGAPMNGLDVVEALSFRKLTYVSPPTPEPVVKMMVKSLRRVEIEFHSYDLRMDYVLELLEVNGFDWLLDSENLADCRVTIERPTEEERLVAEAITDWIREEMVRRRHTEVKDVLEEQGEMGEAEPKVAE